MRIDELIAESVAVIDTALSGESTARLDAELLLSHVLKKQRSYLYAYPEVLLKPEHLAEFYPLLQQRCDGQPMAYLLGEKEFWSLSLSVDKRVLIPRPETEEMVEQVLDLPLPPQSVVADLGTGSGAIALALAKEKPHWFVDASDFSAQAVEVAKQNAQQCQENNNQAAEQFLLLRADWLSAFAENSFDLIVSNPPYIDALDAHLKQGDVQFEPLSALVSPNTGLADIEKIVAGADTCLKAGGYLAIEHGYDQGERIIALLDRHGYQDIVDHHDLAGIPRFVIARKK
jgi:release factor glutamine methyltransferase